MIRLLTALAAFVLLSAAVQAASFRTEDENEAAVRAIATQLRCPVCQSENILDSQSGTAKEMVEIVREQVAQGRQEAEIVAYFRDRYGDYVMLSPPASGFGSIVWATPLLLLLLGGGAYLLLLRTSARSFSESAGEKPAQKPLTPERLEELEL